MTGQQTSCTEESSLDLDLSEDEFDLELKRLNGQVSMSERQSLNKSVVPRLEDDKDEVYSSITQEIPGGGTDVILVSDDESSNINGTAEMELGKALARKQQELYIGHLHSNLSNNGSRHDHDSLKPQDTESAKNLCDGNNVGDSNETMSQSSRKYVEQQDLNHAAAENPFGAFVWGSPSCSVKKERSAVVQAATTSVKVILTQQRHKKHLCSKLQSKSRKNAKISATTFAAFLSSQNSNNIKDPHAQQQKDTLPAPKKPCLQAADIDGLGEENIEQLIEKWLSILGPQQEMDEGTAEFQAYAGVLLSSRAQKGVAARALAALRAWAAAAGTHGGGGGCGGGGGGGGGGLGAAGAVPFPPGCPFGPAALLGADPMEVSEAISFVHYNKAKARHLVAGAAVVRNRFRGRLPAGLSRDQLQELPGIGPALAALLQRLLRAGLPGRLRLHCCQNKEGGEEKKRKDDDEEEGSSSEAAVQGVWPASFP